MKSPKSSTWHILTASSIFIAATRSPLLRSALLMAVLSFAAGCSMFNPNNISARPWDHPTYYDVEHRWMIQEPDYRYDRLYNPLVDYP